MQVNNKIQLPHEISLNFLPVRIQIKWTLFKRANKWFKYNTEDKKMTFSNNSKVISVQYHRTETIHIILSGCLQRPPP